MLANSNSWIHPAYQLERNLSCILSYHLGNPLAIPYLSFCSRPEFIAGLGSLESQSLVNGFAFTMYLFIYLFIPPFVWVYFGMVTHFISSVIRALYVLLTHSLLEPGSEGGKEVNKTGMIQNCL